jgi:hypothetical protein
MRIILDEQSQARYDAQDAMQRGRIGLRIHRQLLARTRASCEEVRNPEFSYRIYDA